MSGDISCPKCDRIDFAWSLRTFCSDCGWTIRPTPVDVPYGFDVLIEVRRGNGLTAPIAKHFKGNERRVLSQSKRVSGYVRLLAIVPLSEERWIAAYGEGRM